MDLLLSIKDFLETAKEMGTYSGAIEIKELETYAEEVYHNNYKALKGMILATLTQDKASALNEKLKKIKEIKDNEK